MSGPWEKYAPPTPGGAALAAGAGAGPWSRYGGSAAAAPAMPETVQEMHPDLTEADRLVVKNFTSGNEQAVNYLQKKHPDLEISVDKDTNQIRARKRDGTESDYRVLDPKLGVMGTLTHPGEMLRDLGDVGYDVASGVGTAAASALGGIAGSAAGGIGALPGAAAAGAAAGTGFEGLRQGLAKLLGVDGTFDPAALATAGVAGAAAPLLFGTGASAGQVAAKALASGGDQAAMAAAQRGLLSRGFGAVKGALAGPATTLASAVSGASPNAIEGMARFPDAVKALETDPQGITKFTSEAAKDVGSKLREAKTSAWSTYENALGDVGNAPSIDIQSVAAPLKAAVADAKATAAVTKTAASRDTYEALRDQFRKLFTYTEQVPRVEADGYSYLDAYGNPILDKVTKELDMLSPKAAAKLEQKLSETAGLSAINPNDIRGGVGNRFAQGATADEKQIQNLGAGMKSLLSEQMASVLPPEAIAAKAQYGQVANLEKQAKPLLKNPSKAFQSLRNADRTPNMANAELFNTLDKNFGTNLLDRAKVLEALGTFRRGSAVPISSGGSTSTSRSIPLALAGASAGGYLGHKEGGHEGAFLGAGLGGAAGAMLGGPGMIRRYMDFARQASALSGAAPAATTAAPLSAWNMMGGAQ